MAMKEIENRIFISDELFYSEYSYYFGEFANLDVTFFYYNVKKNIESRDIHIGNYRETLDFARYRRADGRYKNYEFFIKLL